MPNIRYTIIRSKKFEVQVKAICGHYSRMNELDEAIDWYLSRAPRNEFHLGDNFYLWVTDELPAENIPRVRMAYKVDDANQQVTLLEISAY
jgi:hypothetical protein